MQHNENYKKYITQLTVVKKIIKRLSYKRLKEREQQKHRKKQITAGQTKYST